MSQALAKSISQSVLTKLSLTEARDGLKSGDFSATELTQDYIQAMEETRELNGYVLETPELALEQAAESDKRLKDGSDRPLEGLPIGMKDLFCTQGIRTTAGSNILGNFIPQYESTVSQNLADAGTVHLGKTNMDEFAMGSANITSAFGNVENPWIAADGKALTPGGSSGGSTAVVAAGSAIAATGTDTGGSIRQPAAFTGLVGMKPTYGRCSRWGIVAFASSLDQAGPVTRTVRDAAAMLEIMAGHDPKDSTSAKQVVPNFEAALTGDIRGLRVGIPKEYRMEGMDPEIESLWQRGADWLKAAGAEIVDVSLPHTKYSLPTYYVLAPAEASSNLARYDGVRYGLRVPGKSLDDMYANTRREGFGAEVKRRVMIGTYVLSAGYYDAYYLKAQRVRTLIARDFDQVFQDVDVLLTPTAPSAAFPLDDKPVDPVTMYLNDIFTVPASIAGLPAISVPAGLNQQGLPLGLHLIGPAFDENVIFRTAGVLEEAAQFQPLLAR